MSDVRTSVKDAAYTAVGVGVLGVQQATAFGQQAADKVSKSADDVRTTAQAKAGDARTTAKSTLGDAREQLESIVGDVRERVEPLVVDVRERVEPVIDKVVAKAQEVADIGTAKARTLLGRESRPAATKPSGTAKASGTTKVA